MTELNEENLIKSGYREKPVTDYDKCDRQWSKTFRNEEGKRLYFLTVRMWDFTKYGHSVGYDTVLRLEHENDIFSEININGFKSLEDAENAAKMYFEKTKAIPYYELH